MSVFNTIKSVFQTATPDQVASGEFTEDEDRSYEVFIDARPVTEVRISQHPGDIYVQLDRDSHDSPRAIYLCNEEKTWVLWRPDVVINISVIDKALYPIPCATHGVRYVGTAQEASRASREALQDIAVLAELLATDCGYYTTTKGIKRPVTGVLTSPPNRKRARVPPKPYGMPVPVLKAKTSMDNGKGDSEKGKDEGTVDRMKEKGYASKGKRNVNKAKAKADTDKGLGKSDAERGKGQGKGKADTEKRKGKGKAIDDEERGKGKGKGKGKEKEKEKEKEIWQESDGNEEHDMNWESGPILDHNVPPTASRPTFLGPSMQRDTNVAIDENEEDEMTRRKSEALHQQDIPSTGTYPCVAGYNRFMDGWERPPKMARRLSWSAHDVGTYRPQTGKKVKWNYLQRIYMLIKCHRT